MGSLTTWALLHVIVLLFAWGYSSLGDTPRTCGDNVAVESWACDTPFERAIAARPDNTNFFARAAGVLTGIFQAIFGFLAFDYPILNAEGVMGVFGTGIKLFSWLALTAVGVSLGLRMFGRG